MKCKVCGGESGKYVLCFKCNKLKDEGKIVKCDKCEEWHYTYQPCKCAGEKIGENNTVRVNSENKKTSINNDSHNCIVCGENAPNGTLCRDCYYEMKDYRDSFDKNMKIFELKDYYFNLRSSIYRMKTFDFIKSNCNKLMALAILVKDIYKDESLTDRAENDIKEIIIAKKSKEDIKPSDEIISQDSRKEELLRTLDGHHVKSNPEVIIDDILYDYRIVHCYEKKVPIDSDEQTIKCDWFIPVLDGRRGIYIEYWGMNTKEYAENKERKRSSYKQHNIPLVEIEKDDYKDKQGLTDRIISEINKLAKKHFNVIDYIK